MKDFRIKFRLIFLPFLIVVISFICIYSFLNWLFVVELGIPIDQEVVNLWLPVILVWVPVFFFLRPRVKLLNIKMGKDPHSFYLFVSGLAIFAPTLIAQMYLSTATGKLTNLNSINEINKKPITKYYKISNHYIDKKYCSVYRTARTSGKNNVYLNFYIYITCPVLEKKPVLTKVSNQEALSTPYVDFGKPLYVIDGKVTVADSTSKLKPEDIERVTVLKRDAAMPLYGNRGTNGAVMIFTKKMEIALRGGRRFPLAWLGVSYSKQISNNTGGEEKERDFKEFYEETIKQFEGEELNNFVYLDHIKNNKDYKGFKSATQQIPGYNDSNPIILEAKTEPFEARNGGKLGWIFKSFAIGTGIWLLMLLFPSINKQKLKKYEGNWLAEWEKIKTIVGSLNGDNKHLVTIIIAGINILMFVIMVFAGLGVVSFESNDLYNWGANLRQAVVEGEYWRLLTNMFLHNGVMHLFSNLYGLVFGAILLEPLLRKIKYVVAYLLCGLIASLSSIWWHPDTISVGASGAIFGLYGVLIMLLLTNKVDAAAKKVFLISSGVFIVINLLVGFTGGVDNAAHIGGLVSGVIIGIVYSFYIEAPRAKPVLKKRPIRKITTSINEIQEMNATGLNKD